MIRLEPRVWSCFELKPGRQHLPSTVDSTPVDQKHEQRLQSLLTKGGRPGVWRSNSVGAPSFAWVLWVLRTDSPAREIEIGDGRFLPSPNKLPEPFSDCLN